MALVVAFVNCLPWLWLVLTSVIYVSQPGQPEVDKDPG